MSHAVAQATHTAGPWTVAAFVGADRPVTDAGLYEVEEANEHILDLFKQGKQNEAEAVGEANRCLIAAAPDMLAALEGFLHADPDVFAKELASAHSAIAKAKGGAS